MTRPTRAAAALLLLAACAPPQPAPSPGAVPAAGETPAPRERRESLPAVPEQRGALAIDVVYPGEGAAVAAVDSTFVFGSVGTGGARLQVNGAPVEVAPNGAFLAFLPVPENGLYRLEAEAGGETARETRRVRVAGRGSAGEGEGGESPALTVTPRGVVTVRQGERVSVRVRGPRGGRARLRLPDGTTVPLVETTATERPEGFMLDRAAGREVTEYTGSFLPRAALLSRDRRVGAPTLADPRGAGTATVEVVAGGDTLRQPLELSLGLLEEGGARVAVAAPSRPDGQVIARALPGSGTPYHWQFPGGTRFAVTGEQDGAYRVQLTADQSLWVDATDVRLLPAGAPAPRGTVGTLRLEPRADHTELRISTSERLPFRVTQAGSVLTVEVYGAETRTNWAQYGAEDPWVRRLEWDQPRDDLYTVRLETARPAWGWDARWDEGGALVLRVRRPPPVDRARPLRGMYVAVDAGHPPGGAIGPTRLTEAEANLAISRRLVRMLREAGARVLETRPDTAGVGLVERTMVAADSGVHLLVSVHNNAFPDGVNPFESNGTTVFYNAPQSLGLARHLQRELLDELGLRDLGIARADLALVRPTWMPSALTETMFLMVPRQEAALRDPAVHERIARAHFRGIEAFFRDAAGAGER